MRNTMRSAFVSHARRALSSFRRTLCTTPSGEAERVMDSQKGVMEFIDVQGSAGASRNGRSWRTSELRLKSYEDLHRLWFILLKERNVLLTEKEWCRSNGRHWVNGQSNLYKVKRSMCRIKGVVGERIRALRAKEGRQALQHEADNARGLGDALGETSPKSDSTVVRRTP